MMDQLSTDCEFYVQMLTDQALKLCKAGFETESKSMCMGIDMLKQEILDRDGEIRRLRLRCVEIMKDGGGG